MQADEVKTALCTTQSTLVVFDFDWSLINENSGTIQPRTDAIMLKAQNQTGMYFYRHVDRASLLPRAARANGLVAEGAEVFCLDSSHGTRSSVNHCQVLES